MPVHDWTRVGAGTFHDFHAAWIVELRNALNTGVLPPTYYAMVEQNAGHFGPDVLTLPRGDGDGPEPQDDQNTLVVRHGSDDRIVALIKVASPSNKASRHALWSFSTKAAEALDLGYHLLVLDLHPPGPYDPHGIHGAIWPEVAGELYRGFPEKQLTLAAYTAGEVKTAYIEPIGVGDVLPVMPLFLAPDTYVPIPLDATYQAAWRGVPGRWQRVLEGS